MTTSSCFMMFIMVVSVLFTQMSSPLAMGATLLLQTLLICTAAGTLAKSMWFSYILFLIFLGAMLILFIYVASLAPNEQFSFSGLLFSMTVISMPIALLTTIMWDCLMNPQLISIELSSITQEEILSSTPFNVSMIYSPTAMNLTLFVILYLLLTLIVVVKITESFWGPLRLS
nr:NADH dehydrogenase subunit 6 [Exhippolysmata ensirostris]